MAISPNNGNRDLGAGAQPTEQVIKDHKMPGANLKTAITPTRGENFPKW